MIIEIFKAAVHSVGTATTMTAAGVYLYKKGMITTETKTGMARYTQQIAIPALFFTKIVDCPQNHAQDQCPNILDHLGDAWVLLIWPFYVLGVGLLVGYLVIYLVQPPKWQNNCVLAATAFANAMGMPITLLDVIGLNFQPPGLDTYNAALDPSMFQSIYVILNPVLQWGMGGWLLSSEEHNDGGEDCYDPAIGKGGPNETTKFTANPHTSYLVPLAEDEETTIKRGYSFVPLKRSKNFSFISLEDAGYDTETTPLAPPAAAAVVGYSTGGMVVEYESISEDSSLDCGDNDNKETWGVDFEEKAIMLTSPTLPETPATTNTASLLPPPPPPPSLPDSADDDDGIGRILKKIASKALQPPAIGAMAGFVVASYSPLRGLFVDLQNRADNAPLEWIFDGVLTLAQSAIPVNMCVVGVNLAIASQRKTSKHSVNGKTIAGVVLGKMLVMPIIGIITVYILKTYFWNIPEAIQFQFYLVLLMNFVTPTANVVMVIAELGSGPNSKNVMASLIGWQYVVAPVLLSLTVMLIVWTAVL